MVAFNQALSKPVIPITRSFSFPDAQLPLLSAKEKSFGNDRYQSTLRTAELCTMFLESKGFSQASIHTRQNFLSFFITWSSTWSKYEPGGRSPSHVQPEFVIWWYFVEIYHSTSGWTRNRRRNHDSARYGTDNTRFSEGQSGQWLRLMQFLRPVLTEGRQNHTVVSLCLSSIQPLFFCLPVSHGSFVLHHEDESKFSEFAIVEIETLQNSAI